MALIRKKERAIKYKENIKVVPLEKIIVSRGGLRTDANVDDLVDSIKSVGLLNPLTINSKNELVSGGRRYSALKNLGWADVPVFELSAEEELTHELAHLDENLARFNLDDIETEKALSRRKKIYEKLNPETKRGGDRKSKSIKGQKSSTNSFVKETAKRLNTSDTAVKESIRRAEYSTDALSEARELGEISTSQATEIVRLPMNEQNRILPYLKGLDVGATKSIVGKILAGDINTVIDELDKVAITHRLIVTIQRKSNNLISALQNAVHAKTNFSDSDIKLLTEIGALVKTTFESTFHTLNIKVTVSIPTSTKKSGALKVDPTNACMIGVEDEHH